MTESHVRKIERRFLVLSLRRLVQVPQLDPLLTRKRVKFLNYAATNRVFPCAQVAMIVNVVSRYPVIVG